MGNGTTKSGVEARRNVIAVCGKGGVGKTAFAAMAVKALLESGKAGKLLAIDADPALGLPNALGITVERTIGLVRESIIDAARSGRVRAEIAGRLEYMVLEALAEKEGFALLAMGRTQTKGCFCPVNDILRDAITFLADQFDTIVIDGEAGLEQINRQVMSRVDVLAVLADASSRGRQTVEHIRKLVVEEHVMECGRIGVVFNRIRHGEALLFEFAKNIGIEVLGFVPEDETLAGYDLAGRPLCELPASSPAYAAVCGIVGKLL